MLTPLYKLVEPSFNLDKAEPAGLILSGILFKALEKLSNDFTNLSDPLDNFSAPSLSFFTPSSILIPPSLNFPEASTNFPAFSSKSEIPFSKSSKDNKLSSFWKNSLVISE